ncbi:hypothetical protein WICPIJ_000022 [Wickerhamomyces pijperi]|uniref:Uncharacterized protein n=1 Tax=Wickerhamomyces pijperi TaxID=599730 RepID=A0A9P8TR82_WICPI|nr:hypothetical protein WICPIJ_000022 [Wickerhamomyces pijperi]
MKAKWDRSNLKLPKFKAPLNPQLTINVKKVMMDKKENTTAIDGSTVCGASLKIWWISGLAWNFSVGL